MKNTTNSGGKHHYLTLQLGPVNLNKGDRVIYNGLLTVLLNGILQNIGRPAEAANFIEYFTRERLRKEDIKLLQQVEVIQRSRITTLTETVGTNHNIASARINLLAKQLGVADDISF